MPKLLGRMTWPGFEPRYLHLCVWVYNGFTISSIYQQKKKMKVRAFFFERESVHSFLYDN